MCVFCIAKFYILHCEIFLFYIAKLRISCISHLRNFEAAKNEKNSRNKIIFRNAKSEIFAFRIRENCEFRKIISLSQCEFHNEKFWNFALRKFLQKTYLKVILNKFHLYWIASCGDIQRALMAEQWTVKMNYNGA